MRESENNAIFELQKVKITPDGGLCVNYKLYEQSNCNKFKIQSTNAPHLDMLDWFDKGRNSQRDIYNRRRATNNHCNAAPEIPHKRIRI